MLFVLQVPFHVSGIIFVRLISATGRNHVLIVLGLFMLAVNTAADFTFARLFGVEGIALATSAVFMVSFSVLWFEAGRSLRHAASSAALSSSV